MPSAIALDQALSRFLDPEQILLDPADCWPYGSDNSRLQRCPQAVVLAQTTEQIVELVQLCRQQHLPLTARGRGTGTTGAAVPMQGGVVVSLERMDQILEVDPHNRWLIAQAGATNAAIQAAAGAHGFFWPPDPTSSAYCTLGGNLACNAAGPRAVKYGTPRDNTLGLAAVTGSGRSLRTGVYTTKGVVGYDLTRLLIGSEGTLAIITEATLRLTPLPAAKRLLQAIYTDMHAAAAAVARIMAQSITPCAVEFMDHTAIQMIRDYTTVDLPENAGAILMLEVDGPTEHIDALAEAIHAVATGSGCIAVQHATTAEQTAALWRLRKALSPALRKVAPKKINEDVVVPVSRIPDLIQGLEHLSQTFGVTIVNFGHAGNGNIHVNLLVDPADPAQMQAAERCLDQVFALVLRLDGTLSGEHGIGWVKRDYVARELHPEALTIMRDLQKVFDPDGILNPGKGLPEG